MLNNLIFYVSFELIDNDKTIIKKYLNIIIIMIVIKLWRILLIFSHYDVFCLYVTVEIGLLSGI